VHLNRKKLGIGDQVSEMERSAESVSFVEVGQAINFCAIRITDERKNILGERVIGHIQIKGENVTAGYYNNKKASAALTTSDGWLDTGDLGFFRDQRLYVTGRHKDVLFINGQNYYSHDLERCSEEVEGIELGKVAITGYFDELAQREKIVAFLLHKGKAEDFITRALALKKHINQSLSFELDEVVPVKEISKTTSGKVQRYVLLERYRSGYYAEEMALISV